MNLQEVKQKDILKIKEIYEEAIPEDERISFEDLTKGAFPNSKLFGIYEDKELLGMCYLSLAEDFSYLVYLAVDKDKRNKGYGTNALKLIKEKFKNPIVLCVEQPTTLMRKRRIEFYKRNGFGVADFEFDYLNDKYYTMHTGKINKTKFIDYLLICFPGCTNFKQIKK